MHTDCWPCTGQSGMVQQNHSKCITCKDLGYSLCRHSFPGSHRSVLKHTDTVRVIKTVHTHHHCQHTCSDTGTVSITVGTNWHCQNQHICCDTGVVSQHDGFDPHRHCQLAQLLTCVNTKCSEATSVHYLCMLQCMCVCSCPATLCVCVLMPSNTRVCVCVCVCVCVRTHVCGAHLCGCVYVFMCVPH